MDQISICTGKRLAEKILDTVQELIKIQPPVYLRVLGTPEDLSRTPYYKCLVKDAKRCGIHIFSGSAFKSVIECGEISLSTEIKPSFENNLDGDRFIPCTAEAVIALLRYYSIPISGKHVCIIGRSDRVGRPLSHLFEQMDATVSLCHSKTKLSDILKLMSNSDIIIGCSGDRHLFDNVPKSMFSVSRATVVDVGGEFSNLEYDLNCKKLIPFYNGVGPVTRALLLRNAAILSLLKMKL